MDYVHYRIIHTSKINQSNLHFSIKNIHAFFSFLYLTFKKEKFRLTKVFVKHKTYTRNKV